MTDAGATMPGRAGGGKKAKYPDSGSLERFINATAKATVNREDIAVALTTSLRSSLIAPFSTPELRAAFEQLKDFVRVNATAGEIESRAFRLVGESQAIDREARELFEVSPASIPAIAA